MTKDGNSDRLLSSSPNTDGGPGSGNFGHAGRPGKVGGSSGDDSSPNKYVVGTSYSSKGEYQAAKASAIKEKNKIKSYIDNYKRDKLSELENKYGNETLRILEVSSNAKLSEPQKEVELAKITADMEKKKREVASINDECHMKECELLSKNTVVMNPDYEYEKIKVHHDILDDACNDVVNPTHSKKNCAKCSIAFEMRRRGYDVAASDNGPDTYSTAEAIKSCFVNPECKSFTSRDSRELATSVRDYMMKCGEGSRAIICVYRDIGAGHALNLAVENGEVVRADSQNGQVWSDKSSASVCGHVDFGFNDAYKVYIIRTDNVDVTIDVDENVRKVN